MRASVWEREGERVRLPRVEGWEALAPRSCITAPGIAHEDEVVFSVADWQYVRVCV